MKLIHLTEPALEFGGSMRHIDIRFGLMDYGPFDAGLEGASISATSLQRLAKPAFLCGFLTRSLLMKAATSPLRAVLPGRWAWRS